MVPNTLDAHRLVLLGEREGRSDEVVDRVFRAFFEEGRDIGDRGILAEIGESAGLDPSRVAAQIVTGIGFLGAGVILKEGISVRGLTTAASLWVVASLGMAFGMGYFTLGAITTALVLVSLVFLKKLDPILKKDRYLTLTVTAVKRLKLQDELQQICDAHKLKVSDLSSNVDLVNDEIFFQMVITQQQQRIGRELTREILQLDGIKKVHYH